MKKLLFVFVLIVIRSLAQDSNEVNYGLKVPSQNIVDSLPVEMFRPKGGNSIDRSKDLTPKMPEPGNQGQQGSCTAWTVGYGIKSYQERVETGNPFVFNPAFIFNQFPNDEKCSTGIYFYEAFDFY